MLYDIHQSQTAVSIILPITNKEPFVAFYWSIILGPRDRNRCFPFYLAQYGHPPWLDDDVRPSHVDHHVIVVMHLIVGGRRGIYSRRQFRFTFGDFSRRLFEAKRSFFPVPWKVDTRLVLSYSGFNRQLLPYGSVLVENMSCFWTTLYSFIMFSFCFFKLSSNLAEIFSSSFDEFLTWTVDWS